MLTTGTVVAGHRIEGLLGEGGMATVYEAHQISLNRVVALKILAQRVGAEPAFRDRFRRECEAQAGLDHPNIVPIYEAGGSEYGLWLTMRLVKGPTLRELLVKERLSPDRTLELLMPIAKALDVAHEHGLIHRDITPQNILVDERGHHPYLADFGITKGREDRSLTRTGQFVGTLDYVAPEQIRDETTGATTDVYSLAAILFECLTGRVLFDKESEAAILYAHISENPPQATAIEPALPKAIDPIFDKALAKQPLDRYGKPSDLLGAAERALRGPANPPRSLPPVPPSPSSLSSRPQARQVRRRIFLLGSIVLLLAAVALGLGAIAGNSSNHESTRASAGDLEIGIPPNWTATKSKQSGIPGLRLEDPLILTPKNPLGGESVVVGVSSATGETLLPPALRRASSESAGGTPVSLGRLEALRYRGLSAPGLVEPLGVFASPLSTGVATVACRPGGAELSELCQRLASTLELKQGKSFPLGPSPALAAVLRRQFATLTERRAALRRRLDAAVKAERQAAIASELAAAFRRTAHALSTRQVTPQSAAGLAGVVGGLRSTRDAYKELATAARREGSGAYERAKTKVAEGEDMVDRRLVDMRRLGYRVGTAG
jgi:serine/threonine protein kinase